MGLWRVLHLFSRFASFASVMFASFASISSFCICAASSGETSSSSSSSSFRLVLRETAALAAFPSAACKAPHSSLQHGRGKYWPCQSGTPSDEEVRGGGGGGGVRCG